MNRLHLFSINTRVKQNIEQSKWTPGSVMVVKNIGKGVGKAEVNSHEGDVG